MPPKKKLKEPVQTKLSFKPISASTPPTLFTMEPSTPLRSHMSILNNNVKTTAPAPLPKQGSSSASKSSAMISGYGAKAHGGQQSQQIGGNCVQAGRAVNNDTFSTRELASSIPSSTTASNKTTSSPSSPSSPSAAGYRSTNGNGVTYDYIPGNEIAGGAQDQAIAGNSSTISDNESKERRADIELQKNAGGSVAQPVELDSDSDDEILQMPKSALSTQISTTTESLSSSQTSRAQAQPGSLSQLPSSKLSLLDQMATPRGTQLLPRSSDILGPKAQPGYVAALKSSTESKYASNSQSSSTPAGKTFSRPILISSGSTVSDDGFVSASSLDSRMQGRVSDQDQELTPPLSQSRTAGSYQSLQSKVQSYSQKRSGDLASYSIGGNKKRALPPTITGYQPVPPVTSYQRGYSRTPSFAMNPSLERSRSRSSSPASSPTTAAVATWAVDATPSYDNEVAIGRYTNYPKNMTKNGMILSEEQQHVLEQVVEQQKNVFFTGSAGTGKSVLLRELILQLRSKYNGSGGGRNDFWESTNDAVAVTASTGIAACNIGGCTLHSFAGVGLGLEGLPVLQAKLRKNINAMRRWQDTKVLIIDEVSMIDADFMDKLEALAKFVRKDQRAWGGIQTVLTGDFFQLPPVNKSGNVKFCFEAESWARTISTTIQLQQVFRQKDQTFADMLNEMRLGRITPAITDLFRKLTRDLKSDDGLRPTELFPLRNQVEEANNRMLRDLQGKTVVYQARDRGPMKEKMEQNCLAPTTLQLKVNAQVMLLRNQGGGAGGLVNGSLGILVGFVTRAADYDNIPGAGGERKGSLNTPGEELPLVRFTLESGATREMVVGREEWRIELPNGELQGARVQIPLGLAWSLSIHKSQGQTLPKVRVDLAKVFEKGQAYVALSRATTLEGLQVLNFDPRKVMVHPKVTEFYSKLRVYKKRT